MHLAGISLSGRLWSGGEQPILVLFEGRPCVRILGTNGGARRGWSSVPEEQAGKCKQSKQEAWRVDVFIVARGESSLGGALSVWRLNALRSF